MQTSMETVKTQEGGSFEFEMPLPESLNEAQEVYGDEAALKVFNSGLKVKLQNLAREMFRQEKSQAEVEEAVRAYRPGASSKKSLKQRALDLITERADDIKEDPELKTAVQEAFASSNFRKVVEVLEGEDAV